MATTNLGRVQGAGQFTTTTASGTSVPISTISPKNIIPLVGDGVLFPNGDLRTVTAINTTTVTCGAVVASLKGAAGTNGTNGAPGGKGDKGDTGDAAQKLFDVVIRTQAEFDSLIASPTWLGAKSVAFIGDGGTLEFTANDGIKIPPTAKEIQGFGNAIIHSFATEEDFNLPTIGAIGYAKLPSTLEYAIRNLTVVNTGSVGIGCGVAFFNCANLANCVGNSTITSTNKIADGYAYYNCTNLINCSAYGYGGVGDSSCSGYGFYKCEQLTNCLGSGQGQNIGWGFYDCSYANGCKQMPGKVSKTALWGGTTTKRDDDSCEI